MPARSEQVRSLFMVASVFTLLVLAVGCGDSRMHRLAGQWKLDVGVSEDFVDQLLDGQTPDNTSQVQKIATDAFKQIVKDQAAKANQRMAQAMVLNFTSGGNWKSVTSFANANGQKSGTWTVVSQTDETLTIACQWTDPKSGQVETSTAKVTFLSKDKIKLVPPNISSTEMELTFVREPAK